MTPSPLIPDLIWIALLALIAGFASERIAGWIYLKWISLGKKSVKDGEGATLPSKEDLNKDSISKDSGKFNYTVNINTLSDEVAKAIAPKLDQDQSSTVADVTVSTLEDCHIEDDVTAEIKQESAVQSTPVVSGVILKKEEAGKKPERAYRFDSPLGDGVLPPTPAKGQLRLIQSISYESTHSSQEAGRISEATSNKTNSNVIDLADLITQKPVTVTAESENSKENKHENNVTTDNLSRAKRTKKVIANHRKAFVKKEGLKVEVEDGLLRDWANTNFSSEEIGQAYEEYVAHGLMTKGYSVKYAGIKEGLSDMGIDLIARIDNRIGIIQCKCWAASSVIRANVIMQLKGSLEAFKAREGKDGIIYSAVLYTTTDLDEQAKETAQQLNIKVIKKPLFKGFPRVKITKDGLCHSPISSPYYYDVEAPIGWTASLEDAIKRGYRPPFSIRSIRKADAKKDEAILQAVKLSSVQFPKQQKG